MELEQSTIKKRISIERMAAMDYEQSLVSVRELFERRRQYAKALLSSQGNEDQYRLAMEAIDYCNKQICAALAIEKPNH